MLPNKFTFKTNPVRYTFTIAPHDYLFTAELSELGYYLVTWVNEKGERESFPFTVGRAEHAIEVGLWNIVEEE